MSITMSRLITRLQVGRCVERDGEGFTQVFSGKSKLCPGRHPSLWGSIFSETIIIFIAKYQEAFLPVKILKEISATEKGDDSLQITMHHSSYKSIKWSLVRVGGQI